MFSTPHRSSVNKNAPTTAIDLREVTKQYAVPDGTTYTAVESISLGVKPGRFVSLVGPSGCGKSTLLNLIAGLTSPSKGTIHVFDTLLTGINRQAGYLFQQDALLPWKTVIENVTLGLLFRNEDRKEAEIKAEIWLERVGLSGFTNHFPSQLSGGMRKRVALAQTWIVEPGMLLMDEPFAALDIHTRQIIEGDLLQLWEQSPRTVFFVTHDLEEALAMADEVVVLSAGPSAKIISRHIVDLPRPRNLIDIQTEKKFVELYTAIWSELRSEVLKAHGRVDQN